MITEEKIRDRILFYNKKLDSLCLSIRDFYDCMDEYNDGNNMSAVARAIEDGELILDWKLAKELYEYSGILEIYTELLKVLTDPVDRSMSGDGNKKVINGIIHEARQMKKKKKEEIDNAKAIVEALDEVIAGCDEYRK